MEQFLVETKYMNYSSPVIQRIIKDLNLEGLTDIEKAKKIFYYIRDGTKYSVKGISFDADSFVASNTLQQNSSYCIPKAVALCTLARAVGIPSRLHIVDFINHRLSPGLIKLWGTNVMASHSFSELFINDKWIKLTPALDIKTCDQHDFIPADFDGIGHAMLHPTDKNGKPHVEYINDHGTFNDLPLNKIMEIFAENYGDMITEFDKFDGKFETFK